MGRAAGGPGAALVKQLCSLNMFMFGGSLRTRGAARLRPQPKCLVGLQSPFLPPWALGCRKEQSEGEAGRGHPCALPSLNKAGLSPQKKKRNQQS